MSLDLDSMLKDGCSKKFATYFLNLIANEKHSGLFDKDYMDWCHSKGFLAESGSVYKLSGDNIENYLSDYDYYKSWPLNDWTRIWINDKLTLKYMLSDTEFDRFMPEYYYYCSKEGLRELVDNPYENNSFESFLSLLKEKKEFACKPCNGSGAEGFVKIEYKDNEYLINGQKKSEEQVKKFVNDNPNYIYTEFIYPHKDLYKIDPKIHTLRVIVLNDEGNNPEIIGGYLRFGHSGQGSSNYLHTNESVNIYSGVDFDKGEFGDTKAVYLNRIEDLDKHPDSGAGLSGSLPNFDIIKTNVIGISKRFFGVEFMGFDIGITDDGFKIMEINSHPGLAIPQIFHPYRSDERISQYFERKLKKVDNLSENEKQQRNNILR
ncbi:MAG: hypothetical protein IJT79_03735 [Ruminococcus sp.]|nr:hypothetical protein [Ruminococcus sp.]